MSFRARAMRCHNLLAPVEMAGRGFFLRLPRSGRLRQNISGRRKRISAIAAAVVFAALMLGFVPEASRVAMPAAQAQNLGQRVIVGTVINDASANVAGATVFLRNTKTKSIRSYTSTKDGRFRFVQVNMAEDYDLWAEKDGKKSATKTISSWDSRKEVEAELKIK